MKVSIERTSATEVDVAGYHSVTQSALRRRRVSTDGLVEVTLVRSSRNRLGGGARARPAPAM
jgi:hypothetical protein